MLPFLLLSIRGEAAAADNEYDSFLRFTGLPEAALPRVNLVQEELIQFRLDIKYLVFDLEATRRERDALQRVRDDESSNEC